MGPPSLGRLRVEQDQRGGDFFVGYGISADTHCRAGLRDTVERLGHRPRDEAWGSAG